MKLDNQSRINAITCFIVRIEVVPERFNRVIGRDAQVRHVFLKHPDHRTNDATHGARFAPAGIFK